MSCEGGSVVDSPHLCEDGMCEAGLHEDTAGFYAWNTTLDTLRPGDSDRDTHYNVN